MRLDTPLPEDVYQTLPFVAREELNQLRDYMNKAFEANTTLIYNDSNKDTLYQFRDITKEFAFNIRFSNFDETKRNMVYVVYFSPASLSKIKGDSSGYTFPQVKEAFSRWIDNVRNMHRVTQEYYNPYKKFYDEEFAEFFTNNDEDAAINPFELDKQEVLYYFLTYAQQKILSAADVLEENKDELLKEITELKDNIPFSTKKRVVAALSKIAQKTKSVSNQLFHDVFDVLKKELIKKALYEGAEQVPNAIHHVQHWISLLT